MDICCFYKVLQIDIDLRLSSVKLPCKDFLKKACNNADPNHQCHPPISDLLCAPWRSTSAACDPLNAQKSDSGETLWHPEGKESITQRSEAIFSWDPAFCSGCWCIKPSTHLVCVPSRDNMFDRVPSIYKEEPQSSESEPPRDCFQHREQNVTLEKSMKK